MGAHGTLEEALQGVATYMAPSSEDEEMLEKRRRAKKARKSADGDSSKRKRAHKHGDKEHRKDKRGKLRKRDADVGGDSGKEGDLEQQLQRGRTAVRITRSILQRQPALKQELRQVIATAPLPLSSHPACTLLSC